MTINVDQAGSLTTVNAISVSYDGSMHGDSANWMSTGPDKEGAPLPVTYTGRNGTTYNSTTAPTDAGDYTASATFGGDTNHTGTSGSVDFSIT